MKRTPPQIVVKEFKNLLGLRRYKVVEADQLSQTRYRDRHFAEHRYEGLVFESPTGGSISFHLKKALTIGQVKRLIDQGVKVEIEPRQRLLDWVGPSPPWRQDETPIADYEEHQRERREEPRKAQLHAVLRAAGVTLAVGIKFCIVAAIVAGVVYSNVPSSGSGGSDPVPVATSGLTYNGPDYSGPVLSEQSREEIACSVRGEGGYVWSLDGTGTCRPHVRTTLDYGYKEGYSDGFDRAWCFAGRGRFGPDSPPC